MTTISQIVVAFFTTMKSKKKVTTIVIVAFFAATELEKKKREGAYLQALVLAYHFWLPLQTRCLGSRFKLFRALTMEGMQNEVR